MGACSRYRLFLMADIRRKPYMSKKRSGLRMLHCEVSVSLLTGWSAVLISIWRKPNTEKKRSFCKVAWAKRVGNIGRMLHCEVSVSLLTGWSAVLISIWRKPNTEKKRSFCKVAWAKRVGNIGRKPNTKGKRSTGWYYFLDLEKVSLFFGWKSSEIFLKFEFCIIF